MRQMIRIGWLGIEFFIRRLIDVETSCARRDVQFLLLQSYSIQINQVTVQLAIA